MMKTHTTLVVLGFALVSLVSPLPYLDYIEHVEGEQGYYKDASGSFVFDGTLSPTKGGHVILPTRKPTHSLSSTLAPKTSAHLPRNSHDHATTTDHAATSNVTRRAAEVPLTVAQIVTWLEEEKKWDGKGAVFYTTPSAHETDAEAFAMEHFPGGGQGRWFEALFTDDKHDHMLDVGARKEWTDQHKEESDPPVRTRMCEVMGEYAKSPVYLMIEKDAKPREDANWQYEAKPLNLRHVKVIAVDPSTYKPWDEDLLNKPNEVLEDEDNGIQWKRDDSMDSFQIAPRTMAAPPSIADIKIWLRTVRKWDGRNAVFYTRPVDEDRAAEIARFAIPNQKRGYWFQDLFTDPADEFTHMEDTWGRPGFGLAGTGNMNNKDLIAVARMSEALAEYVKSPILLIIEEGDQPLPNSFFEQHEMPALRRRSVQVIAFDDLQMKAWNENFLDVNMADYDDADTN